MRQAELTKEDGHRIGIPRESALIIAAVDDPEHEKAKSVIRFSLGFGQQRGVYVRDAYRHVLALFPTARGGTPWAHATDVEGKDVVFPKGSIGFYEVVADGKIDLALDLEGTAIALQLNATLEEVRLMAGDDAPAPEQAESTKRGPSVEPPLDDGGGAGDAS